MSKVIGFAAWGLFSVANFACAETDFGHVFWLMSGLYALGSMLGAVVADYHRWKREQEAN